MAPVRPFPAWSLLAGPVVVVTLVLAGVVRMTGGPSLRTDHPTVTTDGPATVESPDRSAPPPTAGPPTAPVTTTASTTGVSPPSLVPPVVPDGTVPAAATTVPPRRSAPTSSVPPVPSTVPPAPAMPSTMDDCRDGGWAELVDDQGRPFAHQGECVAWVNRRSSRS